MIVKKAGCILLNVNNRNVGLIYREKNKDFSFPKGHLEENESLEECAIRETEEEAGRLCKIVDSVVLPLTVYTHPSGYVAEVHNYLAIDIGKSDKIFDEELVHELIWVSIEDVKDKLTYDNLIDLWNEALPMIEKVMDNH